MRTIFPLAAAAALYFGISTAMAAPITVDDFSVSSDNGFAGIPSLIPEASQVAGASILGGYRDVQVAGNSPTFIGTRATAAGGVFAFSNDTGVTGSVTLTWDGDDSPTALDPTGLGGVDLTDGGFNDAFRLEVLSADLAGLQLTLNVFTDAGNASTQSVTIGAPVNAMVNQDFLFAGFSATAGAGADFADVGAIQLIVTGPAEIDATFDLVGVIDTSEVPVPPALALMGSALAGVAYIGRRKRA